MSGATGDKLAPRRPADTKLVICGYLKFTLWRPPVELAERVRQRWPEMRVVHLPHHDQLAPELPDTLRELSKAAQGVTEFIAVASAALKGA